LPPRPATATRLRNAVLRLSSALTHSRSLEKIAETRLDFGYPRPQLERPRWTSLNGPWRFSFDPERRHHHPADLHAWPATITVPYPPESEASGIGDRSLLCADRTPKLPLEQIRRSTGGARNHIACGV
jgi:hypothetical protein